MNQFQGGAYQQGYGQAVAHASVDERASFIMKTYLHLVGAIFAFVAFEAVIQVSGLGMKLMELAFLGGRFGWLVFLGLFMGVSWIADKWARSDTSPGMQYAGLALYTVAEAVIFAPLILMAISLDASTGGTGGGILLAAGATTIVLFGALTGWFPADELRVFYDLKEHKITKFERYVLGFREDGSEGICCPTKPQDNIIPPPPLATFGNVDDEDLEEAETKA